MIPWNDAAVLIIEAIPNERRIDMEGTLREVVNRIAVRPPAEWNLLTIRLPDRHQEPYMFITHQFRTLFDAAGIGFPKSDVDTV